MIQFTVRKLVSMATPPQLRLTQFITNTTTNAVTSDVMIHKFTTSLYNVCCRAKPSYVCTLSQILQHDHNDCGLCADLHTVSGPAAIALGVTQKWQQLGIEPATTQKDISKANIHIDKSLKGPLFPVQHSLASSTNSRHICCMPSLHITAV